MSVASFKAGSRFSAARRFNILFLVRTAVKAVVTSRTRSVQWARNSPAGPGGLKFISFFTSSILSFFHCSSSSAIRCVMLLLWHPLPVLLPVHASSVPFWRTCCQVARPLSCHLPMPSKRLSRHKLPILVVVQWNPSFVYVTCDARQRLRS